VQRTLLFAATGILTLSLVALPITVDPHSGSLMTAAAMAKNAGNGGGHGNSGGSGGGASNGNGGGASNGSAGSNGNAGAAGSNGNSGGSNPAGGDDAASDSASTAGSANTGAAANSAPALAQARQQLDEAQTELAAAQRALSTTVGDGDDTKIAIARGRVAGAQYAVSSAEMNVAAARAGVSDLGIVADSQ
jgi:hypothetical protein